MEFKDIPDLPEWEEGETETGLPVYFFRAKFMEGPLMHVCVGALRPIDAMEYEGSFDHIIVDQNGTALKAPTRADLYKDSDEGIEALEIGFRSLKAAYAEE